VSAPTAPLPPTADPASAGKATLTYPAELTPALREVLGLVVFTTSPVAHAFRDRHSTAEDAIVMGSGGPPARARAARVSGPARPVRLEAAGTLEGPHCLARAPPIAAVDGERRTGPAEIRVANVSGDYLLHPEPARDACQRPATGRGDRDPAPGGPSATAMGSAPWGGAGSRGAGAREDCQ